MSPSSDRLYLEGRLAEHTTDWYTQDAPGNVWYFGEQTAELDATGKVTSTEGTWQAGVDGASRGSSCPPDRAPGQSFRQEFYKGHAEDHFRVVGLLVGADGERAADRGVDAARARRPRPQALRPRRRHGARADGQGRRRAQRARLGRRG